MKRYGLIGYPLTHSFSQRFFTDKFTREGLIDHSYINLELKTVDGLRELISSQLLDGFNITIPHKEAVIPFLDEKNEVVGEIGACNCVKIVKGHWKGYNTDVTGFERTFSPALLPHHRHALILGTGGASKAVAFVLAKLQIPFLFVSTSKAGLNIISYQALSKEIMEEYTVVINTTPLGMYPSIESCPELPYQYVSSNHYFFDLIYNPARTLFLQKASEHGAITRNGHDMLVIQAEESWRIWNSA